ncbi:MAG: hypothetical protein BroJett029_15780 [Alphaproteobacteria bacterium]|nr:MAG: hypothetical protein BroJett029_15780 [Alphaproteobacteria bacterium]
MHVVRLFEVRVRESFPPPLVGGGGAHREAMGGRGGAADRDSCARIRALPPPPAPSREGRGKYASLLSMAVFRGRIAGEARGLT